MLFLLQLGLYHVYNIPSVECFDHRILVKFVLQNLCQAHDIECVVVHYGQIVRVSFLICDSVVRFRRSEREIRYQDLRRVVVLVSNVLLVQNIRRTYVGEFSVDLCEGPKIALFINENLKEEL